MKINFKKLNPVGFYLLRFLQDLTIRFIILFGGSSSGKSYSVAQIILIFTLWEGSNTLVMRKVGAQTYLLNQWKILIFSNISGLVEKVSHHKIYFNIAYLTNIREGPGHQKSGCC